VDRFVVDKVANRIVDRVANRVADRVADRAVNRFVSKAVNKIVAVNRIVAAVSRVVAECIPARGRNIQEGTTKTTMMMMTMMKKNLHLQNHLNPL